MLTAHFHVRTASGFRVLKDGSNVNGGFKVATLIPYSNTGCLCIQFGLKRNSQSEIHGGRKTITVSCKSSGGVPFDGGHFTDIPDDRDHDFLPASLLLSETVIHHRMWRRGFKEETRRKLPGRWNPFGVVTRHLSTESTLVGHGFLRRFENPTIFLSVSCNGEILLPISVGEFAIERLLDTFWLGNNERDCPDQFQLVRSLVQRLGYKVKMVKITERVVDPYFARVFLSKPGENEVLSVDARPCDAISIANRCQAPIYISKEIVFKDAIRISYGTGRTRDKKPCYDVFLDSAADGPDLLSKELDLVRNMNLAVEGERYSDAELAKMINVAVLRDKLMELRQDL